MRLIIAFPPPAFVFEAKVLQDFDLILGLTPELVVQELRIYRETVKRGVVANALLLEAADDEGDLLGWTMGMVRNEIEDSCAALEDLLGVPVPIVLAPKTSLRTGDGNCAGEAELQPGREWLRLELDQANSVSAPTEWKGPIDPKSWWDCRRSYLR